MRAADTGPAEQQNGAQRCLSGLDKAAQAGFSHVLHGLGWPAPAPDLVMACSQARPASMVLGVPVFDARLLTLREDHKISSGGPISKRCGWGSVISLFGFGVSVARYENIMHRQRWMRRFDFDPGNGGSLIAGTGF